ncbi:c-type cytochrome [Camelimonas abortus]|uniref:C-type cytochrome n=1 Tax=Camelimonas abortus TaxID=1017184 RepID=A0ABV7LGW9_9HYPH
MDSFELNKIAGAVLGTLMFVLGLGIVTDKLFENHRPAVPGYDLPSVEEASAGGAAGSEPAKEATPLPVLLAKADAARGERAVAKCKTCHSFEKGGPNKIGPNLYGVVGAKVAHADGFAYSKSMKEHGGEWTFETLNEFLTNPKKAVPGTLMNFAGIGKEEERADILVWLNSQSDSPLPLPDAGQN